MKQILRSSTTSKAVGIVVGLLILSCSVSAQKKAPPINFVPPTPTAAKLFEFQAMQPGMYTGTANVNIPLHTIDFHGWRLSLSLSYHATGVRTDEEASEVGFGLYFNETAQICNTTK
jgi:hypothetical protein